MSQLIGEFILHVAQAFDTKDVNILLNLISLEDSDRFVGGLRQTLPKLVGTREYPTVAAFAKPIEKRSNAFAQFIVSYLAVLLQYDSEIKKFWKVYHEMFTNFVTAFSQVDTTWMTPLLKQLASQLVELSFEVEQSVPLGTKVTEWDETTRTLSRVFNVMVSDRNPLPNSKRQGVFYITNLTMKIYFKLRQIRLCQTLVKGIESANIDMNDYPAGQQVTYKYYVGRYHLFQHQLRKAEADLEFAFRRCTKYHYENKRHIFIHLLTVKLILGYIPTPALLARYGLTVPFADLIKAMLSGNVAQYTAVLDAHMEWFLRTSNYMLLRERGKVVVWRNLFKKVYNITRNPTRNGPPQIRIDHCLIALRLSTLDSYDYMDAESLLVSLLDQGYLKGYIQHYLHIVVLSKQNPFPPVATVQITTEVYDESLNQRDRDE